MRNSLAFIKKHALVLLYNAHFVRPREYAVRLLSKNKCARRRCWSRFPELVMLVRSTLDSKPFNVGDRIAIDCAG